MTHNSPAPLGRRGDHRDRLEAEQFDLAIVGGGITGAGIALDAASRGLRVALVEKGDFASGTSSRSTKLIHGGLRYLAQLEFRLTHEALSERQLLQRLAPGLVEPIPFVLPIYGGAFEVLRIGAGLWLYDLLAGLRGGHLHRRLSRRDAARHVPALERRDLRQAFVYYDCRTDDARLTIEVLRTAVAAGAAPVNYLEVEGFARANGRVVGLECRDTLDGHQLLVRARQVVLACGVWLADVLTQAEGASLACRLRPSKGVHLIVPAARLPGETAFLLPTGVDQRLVFVIPWQGHALIGTTDTEYQGDREAPRATPGDVGYLLDVVNRRFPEARLGPDDVLSVQAGLRPLVDDGRSSTSHVSREDRVFETPSGLIAIAGGKLTTYRRMACRVVDLAVRRLAEAGALRDRPRSITAGLGIGAFGRASGPLEEGELTTLRNAVPPATHDHLQRSYGANAARVLALAADRPELARPIAAPLPMIRAEVVYAARHEMAATLIDVLARRTHVALFDRCQGECAAPDVASLMAAELGWSAAETAAQITRYTRDVAQFSPRRLET